MATPWLLEDGTRALLESGGYWFLENPTTDPAAITAVSVRRTFAATSAARTITAVAARRQFTVTAVERG